MNKRLRPQREPINKQDKTMKRKNKTNTTKATKMMSKQKRTKTTKRMSRRTRINATKRISIANQGLIKDQHMTKICWDVNMQTQPTPTPFCGLVIKEALDYFVHCPFITISLQINQIPTNFIKLITNTSQNKFKLIL
jgi:hypothetical protein